VHAETRYAKSGQVHIAYQVFGHGAVDLVCVPGFISHLEHDLREPHIARYFDRLATFARVIVFDKRGTGLSDRELDHPTLEERMDDIRAVMDVVGSAEAAIYGISEGGSLAALFAATYPERCRALVLYGAVEKFSTWIKTEEQLQGIFGYFDHAWGSGELSGRVAPSLASDSALRDWFRGHERLGASPSAAMTLMRMNSGIDIRHVLPTIRVPTLVLHRSGDTFVDVAGGRYLGTHIAGARYVELEGNDHLPWIGDADAILDRIEEFLTGSIAVVERDRVLATVMFVDMVDSTRTAATLGDKAWREVLDRYHRAIAHEISRSRGRIIKSTGDGVMATFDGPARAIRCGLALHEAIASLGLALRIGIHSGEIELMRDDIGGIAVHVAARVAALAGAGEILATSTVKDLVSGSGLCFSHCGSQSLKGVPGEWSIFAVER
jgi:class 3 adenylate cyclase